MTVQTGVGTRTRFVAALLLSASAVAAPVGCRMFEQPGAAQPALNWFTQFGADEGGLTPPLDLNSIRPAPQTAAVQAGDLLEITVSNLFQPEEPHTFPARVQPDGSIDVPLLGQSVVEGLSRSEIETGLMSEYQRRELLVSPTVIVLDKETPKVKVYVEGAVERPGVVPLPREDASVYAALISAGVKQNAGSHISVARPLNKSQQLETRETAALFAVDSVDLLSLTAGHNSATDTPQISPAEHHHEMPVPQVAGDVLAELRTTQARETPALPTSGEMSTESKKVEYEVIWFDSQRTEDRRALIELRLGEGDIISVSELVPPIKVLGAVRNPGSFNIPNSNDVTLLDAIRLAGGAVEGEETLTVTLIRMHDSGWPGRKWSRTLKELEADSAQVPAIRPGDVIHIERPAGSKLKQRVEGWLNK